ncbi:MAG: thiolase family protein, partial [Deltaproteobacteria bacterium]|nr:thiolase family protein [Deltaproteobacteria bacterium]
MDQRDAIIVSGVRTPIGDFGGSLRDVPHTKLAALVMTEVCRRASFPKEDLDDVYWGIVMPRSDENGVARAAALEASIPEHVPTAQLNRACCSSMEAIRIASMAIRLGEANAILAGGGESMSNVTYSIKNARWGLKLRHHELSDGVWDGLMDHYTGLIMGMTAENVAEKYNISREDQDEFAFTSQMRAKKALEEGRFKDEIVPVVIPGKRGKPDTIVDMDEHPRPDTTLEKLS